MNKHEKVLALKRLIDHPATPEHERMAAQLALTRILNATPKEKISVAKLFHRRMETLR